MDVRGIPTERSKGYLWLVVFLGEQKTPTGGFSGTKLKFQVPVNMCIVFLVISNELSNPMCFFVGISREGSLTNPTEMEKEHHIFKSFFFGKGYRTVVRVIFRQVKQYSIWYKHVPPMGGVR